MKQKSNWWRPSLPKTPDNPGQAFAKCHQEFPNAGLIEGYRRGEYPGEKAITVYQAPSLVRIESEPRPREKQTEFGLLEEISSNGAGIATAGLCS
jgi:hypothetical protein